MIDPTVLRNANWAFTTFLEVVLLVYLVRQKRFLSYPAFSFYVILIILQSAAIALTFRYLGESSKEAYRISWGSQAFVICARWLAVIEITKKTLAKYSGIWALVTRILLVLTGCVLAYTIFTSPNILDLVVLNADRALELCIATFIVCMFLFVRYYRVDMQRFERILAIGFCLYSCSQVINDTLYEEHLKTGGTLWTYLSTLAFLATLLLWLGAVRTSPATAQVANELTVKPEVYGDLSPKLNSRLQLLNNRLNRLFRSEDSHL
jgi:hypothetical protein